MLYPVYDAQVISTFYFYTDLGNGILLIYVFWDFLSWASFMENCFLHTFHFLKILTNDIFLRRNTTTYATFFSFIKKCHIEKFWSENWSWYTVRTKSESILMYSELMIWADSETPHRIRSYCFFMDVMYFQLLFAYWRIFIQFSIYYCL